MSSRSWISALCARPCTRPASAHHPAVEHEEPEKKPKVAYTPARGSPPNRRSKRWARVWPPEQALGYELDGRADLYALGCIGFFLLSGRLLFEDNGSLPMMMAHITDTPPEFKTRISNYLPAELAALLMQCLAKKPLDRPSDARALAASLKVIHIPPAESWSEARAQAWWAEQKPNPRNVETRHGLPSRPQQGIA